MQNAINHIRKSLSGCYPSREIDEFIKIIFQNLMGYSQVDIILHKDSELSGFMRNKVNDVVADLLAQKPIQYIFGNEYFYGRYFKVTPDTLIPRPETAALIDMIVERNTVADLRVLDIGTGSGCIAVSLSLAMNFPIVDAVDISPRALDVARENAVALKAKVNFRLLDILNASPCKDTYDIIVSNPPYICEKEKADMHSNVLDYEPASALFVPDDNPLLFYSAIANYALVALSQGGRLYFEINSLYCNETCSMLRSVGFVDVESHRDYFGHNRFVSCLKPAVEI